MCSSDLAGVAGLPGKSESLTVAQAPSMANIADAARMRAGLLRFISQTPEFRTRIVAARLSGGHTWRVYRPLICGDNKPVRPRCKAKKCHPVPGAFRFPLISALAPAKAPH